MEFAIFSVQINPWLLIYLSTINLVTLIAFGADKIASRSGAWRTRERTLLLLSLLGGSLGAIIAIYFFRHKTRKDSFLFLLAVVLLVQLAIIFYLQAQNASF